MTAESTLCDRGDLGDQEAQEQASQDVAGPMLGQVHTGDHHERQEADRKPSRDAGHAGQEGGPGDVAAGERAGEGDVGEREQLDRAGQLSGWERLGHGRLEDDLDREHGGEQERDPSIALAASQAGEGEPEGDAAGDLSLAEEADGRREEVEPRRADGLHEIDHRAIELVQCAEGDEDAQRDEEQREQRDADQR